MKYVFVFSSHAGKGSFNRLEEAIQTFYRDRGLDFEIIYTSYKDHARDLVKTYKDQEDLIFYVCSGDGTLGEVADQMMASGARFSLGHIPSGTANDFAKNFDFTDLDMEATAKPQVYPIDLIQVNDRHSINVLSLGFDTQVLASTYQILEKKPHLGHRAYARAVLKNIFKIPSHRLSLDLDLSNGQKQTLQGDFILGAICNGGFYGGGFNPSPRARINDGVLEMCLAKKIPLIRLIPLILKYKKGTHIPHRDILFKEVKGGIIRADQALLANVDGEIFQAKEVRFQVKPQAISYADASRRGKKMEADSFRYGDTNGTYTQAAVAEDSILHHTAGNHPCQGKKMEADSFRYRDANGTLHKQP